MPLPAVIAVVVAVVLVAAVVALGVERSRRNRRFARKLSPYERRRRPGGDALDADEWIGRR